MPARPAPTAYERHAPDPRLVEQALAPSRQAVFWLEDSHEVPAPTPLTASTRADLVVVGGGYLGLWTAVLAKRRDPGQHVVLLEAQRIGWAASGRNGGFCEASITHGEANGRARWPDEYDVLDRLGRQNLDAFEADVASWGLDCEWERTGVVHAAVEEHELDWLGPDRLDAAGVRALVDSPLFLGGRKVADEAAMVHPARLAHELARVARELGVGVHEGSAVEALSRDASGRVRVETARATVLADRVVLATNVFPSLLRRARPMTVPVYDYVLMSEPLTPEQRASIGWAGREGLGDLANQFHYSRLTADDRILYGGYDAVYHFGGRLRARYEDRPESFTRLASHFFATFPQLEGLSFTHRWAGAIDTCTRFAAFYGLAHRDRVAYAAGFTGLGVGATRFAAEVLLDLLAHERTERTELEMVRRRPLPFPPEPARGDRHQPHAPLARPRRPPAGPPGPVAARPRRGRARLRLLTGDKASTSTRRSDGSSGAPCGRDGEDGAVRPTPARELPHDHLDHALGGRPSPRRRLRPVGRRHQPRHRPGHRPGRAGRRGGRRRRHRAPRRAPPRRGGRPRWRARTQVLFAFRELLNSRKGELAHLITAEHGKVHSDALGEIARGQEVVEFACGISHLLKGGHSDGRLDRRRRALQARRRSAWSASSARSTSRRWCRCGSSRSRSRPATRSCSSRARRTRPPPSGWPSCGRRPACPTASSTSSRATRSPSTRCCSRRTSRPSASSAPPRSRSTSTSRPAAHGKRVQALGGAKNHMVVLPDADLDLAADAAVNAGYGSRRRALHGDQRARRRRPGGRRPRRPHRRAHPHAADRRRRHERHRGGRHRWRGGRRPTWVRW